MANRMRTVDDVLRKYPVEETELEIEDLRFVVKALESVSAHWHGIATHLKVPNTDEIDRKYHGDPLRCLIASLSAWLQSAGDDTTNSWRRVVYVAGIRSGGDNLNLARKIAENYKTYGQFQPGKWAKQADTADLVDEIDGDDEKLMDLALEIIGQLDVVTHRWFEIGILIGLPLDRLEGLVLDKSLELSDRLKKMIKMWLEGKGDERVCWQVLVDAVESNVGGKNARLAKKIAEQHPPQGGSSNGEASLSSGACASVSTASKPPLVLGMINIKKFPGKNGKINIIEKVAMNCTDLGTYLLNDDDGTKVPIIKADKGPNPKDIAEEIFSQWFQGRGTPVTWEQLLESLRDADFTVLAKEIEQVLSS